jgi:hypothetical protein
MLEKYWWWAGSYKESDLTWRGDSVTGPVSVPAVGETTHEEGCLV